MKKVFFILICLLTFTNLYSQTPIELEQARMLKDKGDVNASIDMYKEFIKQYKNNKDLYLLISDCFLELGEDKNAESYLKKAIKQFPDDYKIKVALYILYEQTNQHNKKDKLFKNILSSLKANNYEIQTLGNELITKKHWSEAKVIFLKGRELIFDNTAYSWQLSNIFFQEGDYQNIAKEYLIQLENNPKTLKQIETNILGLITNNQDIAPIIEKEWETYWKKNKNNPYFAQFGIWLYSQTKQYDKSFELAKQIDNKFEEESGATMLSFGEDMLNSNNINYALKAVNYMLKKGKESAFYQRCRALSLSLSYKQFIENPIKSESDFNRLEADFMAFFKEFSFSKESFEIILQIGNFFAFHINKPQEAVDMLEEAINKGLSTNQKGEIKLLLAKIYNRYGDMWQASLYCSQVEQDCKNSYLADEAKLLKALFSYYNNEIPWALSQFKALRSSTTKLIANDAMSYSILIEENIDQDSTYNGLRLFANAEKELEYNNPELAKAYLDTLTSSYIHHPLFDDVFLLKAKINIAVNNFDKAKEYLNESLKKYPYELTADDALFLLSEICLNKTNEKALAKELLEKIILDYPNSIYVTEARKLLKEL
ncbi:MAG: tetratricopeptide repeat protein [Bacteroidales bacterium]|nr:tetratricopeptide repeat protein [Bacteroidales bacterium]MEE1225717.1 tetratricopeptide repeat protein [Bacteroidales bacterium]